MKNIKKVTNLFRGLQQVPAAARVVLRVLAREVLGERARRELRLAHVAEVAGEVHCLR